MRLKNLLIGTLMTVSAVKANAQKIIGNVTVTNLKGKSGTLMIGWYINAKTFPQKGKAVFFSNVNVSEQQERAVSFGNIPEGIYAIAVFLDENNNGQLDKNFLGVPKEKYGFSNNALPIMRQPTFDEAAFKFSSSNNNVIIKLK